MAPSYYGELGSVEEGPRPERHLLVKRAHARIYHPDFEVAMKQAASASRLGAVMAAQIQGGREHGIECTGVIEKLYSGESGQVASDCDETGEQSCCERERVDPVPRHDRARRSSQPLLLPAMRSVSTLGRAPLLVEWRQPSPKKTKKKTKKKKNKKKKPKKQKKKNKKKKKKKTPKKKKKTNKKKKKKKKNKKKKKQKKKKNKKKTKKKKKKKKKNQKKKQKKKKKTRPQVSDDFPPN